MILTYLAHNGVEHATAAQAAAHEAKSDLPVILAVTIVVLAAVAGVVFFLSKSDDTNSVEEE